MNDENFNIRLRSIRRKCFDKLTAYTPGEQPQNVKEWIKLNTNENPYEPPQSVINQLTDAINYRMRMYPDPMGKELREIIAQNYLSQFATLNSAENIALANGSDETLDLLFKTFIDPGDGVVYFSPSYGMYSVLAQSYGAVEYVFALAEDDFSIQNLEFRHNDKLMIICSPNNPNGNVVSFPKLEEICDKFPGIVFVDEAYGDFADDSALTLLPKHKNLIVGKTFSKSSSLASIRLGFSIATKEIIDLFNTVRLPYNVSYLTQMAGIAAMKSWSDILKNVDIIKSERKRTINELKSAGYDILPTQSNFYLIRFKNVDTAVKIYEGLKHQKILVRYWSKPNLARYIRVTVGTPEQNNTFISAMKKFATN